MRRIPITIIAFVCLIAPSVPAQDSKPVAARTIVLDVSVIEINRNQLEEVERLVKEQAKLDRFIADGKARPVANIQVQARSGENASAHIGQRMPVQSSAPTPATAQIQYENTGLNLDAKPTVIDNGAILVWLKIEFSGLIKTANPQAPAYIQRSFSDSVQVRANEPTLLLGVAQHEFLWSPSSPPDTPAGEQTRGSFVVLLTARLLD